MKTFIFSGTGSTITLAPPASLPAPVQFISATRRMAQQITMDASSMTETFYNFAINNSHGVTINKGNISVANQLMLTSGNITTTSTHNLTITNTDTGAVVGGGVNSFVNGPIKKTNYQTDQIFDSR